MGETLNMLCRILGVREPDGPTCSVLDEPLDPNDPKAVAELIDDKADRRRQRLAILMVLLSSVRVDTDEAVDHAKFVYNNLWQNAQTPEAVTAPTLEQQLLSDLAEESIPKLWFSGMRVFFETEHGVSYAQDPLLWIGPDANRYFVGFNDDNCCQGIHIIEFNGASVSTEEGKPPSLNSLSTGLARYSGINNTLTADEHISIGDVRSFANGTLKEALTGGALDGVTTFQIEGPEFNMHAFRTTSRPAH